MVMALSLIFPGLIILVNAVHFSTQQAPNCTAQPFYNINYRLEFPLVNCSGDNESLAARPDPILLTVPCGETAQRVMELAVFEDPYLTFTVTFINIDDTVGYRIDAVNGTENDGECFWFFYYQEPNADEAMLQDSIMDFIIPQNGSSVILRYQTIPETPTTPIMMTTDGAYRSKAFASLLVFSVALAYGLVR